MELKAHRIDNIISAYKIGKAFCMKTEEEVYIKSEADKVFADKDKAFEYSQAVILVDIEIIKKQKIKRCLAMAKWCEARYDEEDAKINGRGASWDYISQEMKYWERWQWRWQELADKIKKKKKMESTIEIRHNGACVKITCKNGRCYYNTSGQPSKELVKVIQYLEQVRAPMATASKMVISEMLK